MKGIIILIIIVVQSISAQTFKCSNEYHVGEYAHFEQLNAVYLDGVLRGNFIEFSYLYSPNSIDFGINHGKSEHYLSKLSARVDDIVIRESDVYIREYQGNMRQVLDYSATAEEHDRIMYALKILTQFSDSLAHLSDSNAYISVTLSEPFYIPLSKNELKTIQYTDALGHKCLNISPTYRKK